MSDTLMSSPGSLAFSVVIYFARNPDEELSSDDIAVKWPDEAVTCVASRLRKYKAEGVLAVRKLPERKRNGAQELIWSAGPKLLDMLR
jgi:hypothetical protein